MKVGSFVCLSYLGLDPVRLAPVNVKRKNYQKKLETPAYGAAVHEKDVQRREKASICMYATYTRLGTVNAIIPYRNHLTSLTYPGRPLLPAGTIFRSSNLNNPSVKSHRRTQFLLLVRVHALRG